MLDDIPDHSQDSKTFLRHLNNACHKCFDDCNFHLDMGKKECVTDIEEAKIVSAKLNKHRKFKNRYLKFKSTRKKRYNEENYG